MNENSIREENLREAAAVGNEDNVEAALRQGVNVNAQNTTNGWTALHWACKRGNYRIVERLLRCGADVNLVNAKGETCLQLTESSEIRTLLGGDGDSKSVITTAMPIVPNYISNPPFPYTATANGQHSVHTSAVSSSSRHGIYDEMVLKVRVANSDEKDFIEIDVPVRTSFTNLVRIMRTELEIGADVIVRKVRKLPDTIVRNDRDVQRLRDYHELELVLATDKCSKSTSSKSVGYKATVSPKEIDVVY